MAPGGLNLKDPWANHRPDVVAIAAKPREIARC